MINSGAPREAPRVGGAPQLSKFTHPRKFSNHVTVHRATERPSAPQGNQCLLSHFLDSLGAKDKTNCILMLWSIDSYQNRVYADQYHLTVPRAQVSTHRSRVFLKLCADKLPVSNDRSLKFIFSNDSSVRNIPKFKDRASWSRDTFQPMRRRACVYQQSNQTSPQCSKIFKTTDGVDGQNYRTVPYLTVLV